MVAFLQILVTYSTFFKDKFEVFRMVMPVREEDFGWSVFVTEDISNGFSYTPSFSRLDARHDYGELVP